MAKGNVLIISPESWGINFVSKHHYAIQLAKEGYNVYFLNPPSNASNIELVQPYNVKVINYASIVRGINKLPHFLRVFFYKIQIFLIHRLIKNSKWEIVWSFDPFRFQDLRGFDKKAKTIYYAADIHQTDLDNEVAATSDLVIGPSKFCISKFNGHPNCHFINHGIAAHFLDYNNPEEKPSEKIRFAYAGNLVMKFIDYDLLYDCIKQNPEVEFHLIGSIANNNLSGIVSAELYQKLENILSLENVIHKNSIPNIEFPEALNQYDGFLMCFGPEEAANSHKILEYLSTGKVVLTLPVFHYADKGDLLIFSSKSRYLASFESVKRNIGLYNSKELQQKRKEFAKSNSYAKHIETILSWLK